MVFDSLVLWEGGVRRYGEGENMCCLSRGTCTEEEKEKKKVKKFLSLCIHHFLPTATESHQLRQRLSSHYCRLWEEGEAPVEQAFAQLSRAAQQMLDDTKDQCASTA